MRRCHTVEPPNISILLLIFKSHKIFFRLLLYLTPNTAVLWTMRWAAVLGGLLYLRSIRITIIKDFLWRTMQKKSDTLPLVLPISRLQQWAVFGFCRAPLDSFKVIWQISTLAVQLYIAFFHLAAFSDLHLTTVPQSAFWHSLSLRIALQEHFVCIYTCTAEQQGL